MTSQTELVGRGIDEPGAIDDRRDDASTGTIDEQATRVRREHVTGRLDALCGAAGGTARYDSVVIVGDEGITTNTFAARLARDPQFEGRVTVAGGPVVEDRRLRAGVSLRGHAADYLLHALDTDLGTLVEAITPGRWPVATRQTVCMAEPGTDGFTFSKSGPWQNHFRSRARPIVFGFRNSRTAVAVRELTAAGVVRVDEQPTSVAEARDLASGERPLVVDATHEGRLTPRDPGSGWGIAAVQAPFSVAGVQPVAPFEARSTTAPLIRREGRIDVGYFTPFADSLSPSATWYGILARPVNCSDGADERARQLDALTTELLGIARAAGLGAVDLDETLGRAWVPAPSWSSPHEVGHGVFDLRRACTPGIAAYYADGMTGAAVAGVTAAEAIIRGSDPVAASNAALRRFRRWNRVWWFETAKIAWVADKLTRISPQVALSWPHSTSISSWASAA